MLQLMQHNYVFVEIHYSNDQDIPNPGVYRVGHVGGTIIMLSLLSNLSDVIAAIMLDLSFDVCRNFLLRKSCAIMPFSS